MVGFHGVVFKFKNITIENQQQDQRNLEKAYVFLYTLHKIL